MEKIDFVVLWVDGNDPAWIEERKKYLPIKTEAGAAINRFRDWGLMRYWFRGIEKFAPWVNNVYFVTWGHYPEWLNLAHPKLKIVKHRDYIPHENLPTFNSNVIELYLHKIPELNEQFVLFNDDTFLVNHVKQTDFFEKGLPCDCAWFGRLAPSGVGELFPHTMLNNTAVLNKYFDKKAVIKKYWKKYFSIKYGKDIIRNVLLSPFNHFSAFHDTHLPASHLKSTFEEVWKAEPDYLQECGTHRFRNWKDVTHWLMKNWRFCQGKFEPRSNRWGKCFEIGCDDGMVDAIKKKKYKAICLNDSDPNLDFCLYQRELVEAFEAILPEKSSFEK